MNQENFFTLHDFAFHEICFFYSGEWSADPQITERQGSEIFAWIKRQDIHKIDLRPAFIKQTVLQMSNELQLVIFRDEPDLSPHTNPQ